MPDRPSIYVHLLPSLIPPGALRGGVAVVVDVLRATTVMVHALAAGCEAILPCLEIDDARRVAADLPAGTALLGGERGGLPIEGFDLGNSPEDYTPEVCRGKTLVMTTTNGTRAILASLEAERVLIGAFVNLGAVAEEIVRAELGGDERPIHIVCAGTEGFISHEDSLLAGALVGRLVQSDGDRLPTGFHDVPPTHRVGNDQTFITNMAWLWAMNRPDRPPIDWWSLANGRGGKNILRLGLEKDIQDAARIDRFDLVPAYDRGTERILLAGRF